MSEEKKAFTVKDRRHFTAEGEARSEEPEATPEPERPRPSEPPAPARPVEEGFHVGGHAPAGDSEGIDFLSFAVSLAAQCGELLSPAEGGPHLPEARQTIAILEMLEEKARTGFSAKEKDALGQILYELRMAFVAVSRRGTP
jgi:hypothetical protein